MYWSSNSRAVDVRLLYFTFTHSRPSQKLTSTVTCMEMNVIHCREDDVSLCSGTGVFKTLEFFMLFARNYYNSDTKMNISKRFSKVFMCHNYFMQQKRSNMVFRFTSTCLTPRGR